MEEFHAAGVSDEIIRGHTGAAEATVVTAAQRSGTPRCESRIEVAIAFIVRQLHVIGKQSLFGTTLVSRLL